MSSISAGTTSTTTLVHSGDTTGSLVFKTNDTGSGGTTAVTIDTSQNVTCVGNITLNNGSADGAQLTLNSAGYSAWNWDNYSGRLRAYYNATEYFTIDTSGNVGIGTNAPTAKLQVSVGNVSTFGQVSNAGLAITGAGANNNYAQIGLGYAGTYQPASIGYITTTQTGYTYGDIVFGTRSVNTDTAPSERMRIDSSGNLLVGTTTADAYCRFSTQGAVGTRWGFGPSNTGSDLFRVQNSATTGVYLTNGGTSWTANSDERIKDIIEPISNATNKVATLRSVIGKYKTDADNVRRCFLIAQDVQAVLPEAVHQQDDELGTLGVSYSDVIPLLVASIKELKTINDQQAETINALTARVVALESK